VGTGGIRTTLQLESQIKTLFKAFIFNVLHNHKRLKICYLGAGVMEICSLSLGAPSLGFTVQRPFSATAVVDHTKTAARNAAG
jgi:hypothetical protein